MQLILDNILPVGGLTALIVLCIVGEALIKKFRPALRALSVACVAVAVLAGAGLFLFMLSIGAGTELILPVVLLVMFISMLI